MHHESTYSWDAASVIIIRLLNQSRACFCVCFCFGWHCCACFLRLPSSLHC